MSALERVATRASHSRARPFRPRQPRGRARTPWRAPLLRLPRGRLCAAASGSWGSGRTWTRQRGDSRHSAAADVAVPADYSRREDMTSGRGGESRPRRASQSSDRTRQRGASARARPRSSGASGTQQSPCAPRRRLSWRALSPRTRRARSTVEAASAHEAARAQAMEITAELDYTSAVAKAVFLAIDRPPRDAHRRDRLSPRRRRRQRGAWLTTRRAPRGDLARVQTAPHGRVRLGFNLD